jgi:hypothetical protein
MIDPISFANWMMTLGVRFNKDFTAPQVISAYRNALDCLNTEQFCAAAESIFQDDISQFPSPKEFVKLARTLVPDLCLPEAPPPKKYDEMSPEEQAEYREAIAQFVANLPKGAISRVGKAIAQTALEGQEVPRG